MWNAEGEPQGTAIFRRNPVHVTVLGEARVAIPARVIDVSCSGVRLEIALPIPCGSRLQIDYGSSSAFGEAVWCNLAGERYAIGVKVTHLISLPRALDDRTSSAIHRHSLRAARLGTAAMLSRFGCRSRSRWRDVSNILPAGDVRRMAFGRSGSPLDQKHQVQQVAVCELRCPGAFIPRTLLFVLFFIP
jgi:hypothetical protein